MPVKMTGPESNTAAREAVLAFLDGKITEADALDLLLDAVRTQDDQGVDGDKAWASSLELFKIAYDPPNSGDATLKKLADFVVALAERPESRASAESKNGVSTTFWDTILMTSREMWNLENQLTDMQWRNLHAFLAQLWATGMVDGALWAIWCLRSELEEIPENDQQLKIYASEAYVQYAGHLMFKCRQEWDFNTPGNPKSGNRARVGSLLKGQKDVPNGYSAARWAFWKERFQQIMDLGDGNEAIQETARRALSCIHDIEVSA